VLDRLLARFRFVRNLIALRDAAAKEVYLHQQTAHKAEAAAAMIEEERAVLEEQIGAVRHSLEVETAKRIAAETIAAARGQELEWLRTQFQHAEEARDTAVSERLQSLDLVNSALLTKRADDGPVDFAQFKPLTQSPAKLKPAAMIRQAERAFVNGIRLKAKGAQPPAEPQPVTDKVQ
jgi:hypothetical protein